MDSRTVDGKFINDQHRVCQVETNLASAPRRRYRRYLQVGDNQRYRSSFGAAAVEYAEHRPNYAEAALRWALEFAPGTRVLDLGAGTGKLTEGLVALGVEVIAVEPDPAMLVQLRSAMPTVNALAGSAETIPLPDASVDAVLAGNALHWFDMAIAGPEIARVLAPGGILAGLWNIFDNRIEWVAELARVGGSQAIGPRDTVTDWQYETARMHLANGGAIARFDSSEQAVFQHGQRRSADTLVATFATKAGVLVMPAQEREAVLLGIREFLVGNSETAIGEFTLPMLTGVLRVRRVDTIRR
jgi:SAM-dependent methyltransferase